MTMVTDLIKEMDEAVERGARLLDEKIPGWAETVRGAMTGGFFRMSDWGRCVCGTLELVERDDNYDRWIVFNGTRLSEHDDAEFYGFVTTDEPSELEGYDAWDTLDGMWRRRVEQRTGALAEATS